MMFRILSRFTQPFVLKIFIIFIVLSTLLIIDKSSSLARDEATEEPQQQIQDFSIAGFGEKGKKSWDISGESADMSQDAIYLNNIVGNFYGEKDNVRLTADKGNFDKTEGKLHLEQNVVITTSSGAKLTTDSLDWDKKSKVVATLDKVNIERENMITTAQGATGEPNLNKISLEKDVQVEIKPQEKEGKPGEGVKNKIIITCDGPLQIDYQKNIGTFNNNVKVETQDVVIYSDTMEVYFIKAGQSDKVEPSEKTTMMGASIDKIIARGNVKIARGDNISYSEEATYSAQDKKITLSGSPKLIIYSTEDFKNAPLGN